MAASFAISHIAPDAPDPLRSIKHDLNQRRRITRAARMIYGRDAAWTALILGSIHPWHIGLSRQARYYSAQVLLSAACCVLVWLMIRRGRWRHFVLAGLGFVLLFHTHLLSFVTQVSAHEHQYQGNPLRTAPPVSCRCASNS